MSARYSPRPPRAGTGPFIALTTLHALTEHATEAKWRAAAARKLGNLARQDRWGVIVQALINAGMVFQRRDVYIVSDDGLAVIGQVAAVVPRAEPQDIPQRYVPPMRSLSAQHLVKLRSMREGAWDYRTIPSLHGDDRVAYRSSLHVDGAQLAPQEGVRR